MKQPRTARKYIYLLELVLLVSLVAGSLGLANYIFSRNKVRFDLTPDKSYTLSPLTLQVLDGLSDSLHVTIFHKRDEQRQFQDLIDLLRRASKRVAFQFVDLDKNPARAASFDITHYGAAIIDYQGRRERMQFFTEENLVAAILRLTEKDEKIVRVVTGHGEKKLGPGDPVDSLSLAHQALERENYRVEPLLLMKADQVPDDTLILVIAGPQQDYFEHELKLIYRFVQRGGRVLMMLDSFPLPRIEQFMLTRYAIELSRDYIIDTRSKLMGFDILSPLITPDARHPIARFMNKKIMFPYGRSVLPRAPGSADMVQTVLAVSGPDSWAERDTQSVREGSVRFDPREDMAGPVPVAVIVELPSIDPPLPGGCLVVMGNSNFATDHYFSVVGNRDFFLNTVNWLADRDDLLAARGSSGAAPELYFMTRRQGRIIYWSCVVIQPALVLLCGLAVIWWRRRRV